MTTGRTVLVVEPDRAAQRALSEALQAAGFLVLAEHDAEWALRTFDERAIDLLVTSATLPRKTGVQLAKEIRKTPRGKGLPIVLLGAREQETRVRLDEPLRVLERPIEPAHLVTACQRALGMIEEPSDPGRRRRERADPAAQELASTADLAEAREVESDSQVRFRGAALVRGDLRELPFAEVLGELHRWRATGALLIERAPVKKVVWMREGAPVFVRSNLLAEALGQILVRERMVSAQECEQALARMQASKSMLGTELIRMRRMSPANLAWALQLQLEEKLFDLFSWTEGTYRFNPRAQIPAAQVHVDLTCAKVLYEGIRRTVPDARARTLLGGDDATLVEPSGDPMDRFQDMGLEPAEARLHALVDGTRTVGALLASGELPQADACRLLYALRCANMIHFGAVHAQEVPKPAPIRPAVPRTPAEALVGKLAARAQRMREGTLYDTLGVSPDAADPQIRWAFEQLAPEVHPDRLSPDAGVEVRALAEEIFHQLVNAQEILLDRGRRTQYDLMLRAGSRPAPSDEVSRIVAAEAKFRTGEASLRAGDAAGARKAYEEAVRLWPQASAARAALGWTLWLTAKAPGPAYAEIDAALRLDPRLARAWVYRGKISRALGRAAEGQAELEKALLCNPTDAEALAELAAS